MLCSQMTRIFRCHPREHNRTLLCLHFLSTSDAIYKQDQLRNTPLFHHLCHFSISFRLLMHEHCKVPNNKWRRNERVGKPFRNRECQWIQEHDERGSEITSAVEDKTTIVLWLSWKWRLFQLCYPKSMAVLMPDPLVRRVLYSACQLWNSSVSVFHLRPYG
jgi:hypothetical protein